MRSQVLDSAWWPGPAGAEGLVVVLHGRGDSYDGFSWLPAALGLPVHHLAVNAPDPYYTGYSWYDLPPDQAPGVLRSRALLDQLFAETAANGFAPEQTVLFGFSQGCLMGLEWGVRSPLHLAGIVGISGYCLDPDALAREASPAAKARRWLVTHGTSDDVLPYDVTARQVSRLQELGLPIAFQAYRKGHTIDPVHELPHLRAWMRGCWA